MIKFLRSMSLTKVSRLASILLLTLGAPGCGGGEQAGSGSNSNWLVACEATEECGAGSCVCGLCTLECLSSADCEQIPGASCVDSSRSAARSQCPPEVTPRSLCLQACQPGECDSEQLCFEDQCVHVRLPDSDYCAATTEQDGAAQMREEELLAALQMWRQSTSAACGGEPPVSLPALRLDGRLVCAARNFAADLASTGGTTLTDSGGRDSEARFALSDYTALTWGESFATEESVVDLFATLTVSAESCPPLVDITTTDVGVGCFDQTCVISLGSD